jgi:hypothetical protein
MNLRLWVLPTLLAGGAFEKVDTLRGIPIEARTVDGTGFEELRLSVASKFDVARMCPAVAQVVTDDGPFSPDVAVRKTLSRDGGEVVFYDRIRAPLISERDYAMRMRFVPAENGCQVLWNEVPELAPKLPDGVVRMPKVRGAWSVEGVDGGTSRITYQSYVNLGGAVPAWIARGGTRQAAARDVQRVLETSEAIAAKKPSP